MGLFDFLKPKRPRNLLEQLQANPEFQRQKVLFDMMNAMCAEGCDADTIPGGHGEFGHSLSNPIPTNTVFGSTSYLARLRAPDGTKVGYDRQGSFASPVSSHPVDGYAITHADGRTLATLYLSPYHKRNSSKAPTGFQLLATIAG